MQKAVLLTALIAAMVFGSAVGVSAQSVPGGAADDQYCTPAEAQYGECDDDVTIIVAPPAPPSVDVGAGILPGPDTITGDIAGGAADDTVPAGAISSSEPSSGASGSVSGATGSETDTVSVLPDTGGVKLPVPALGAFLIVVIGAALLFRSGSRA